MTTTARIVATANQAFYSASIAAGSVGSFIAIGLSKDDPPIVVEGSNAAASAFEPLSFIDKGGDHRTAQLTYQHRTIVLNGPIDFRINKPATAGAVEVSQYT